MQTRHAKERLRKTVAALELTVYSTTNKKVSYSKTTGRLSHQVNDFIKLQFVGMEKLCNLIYRGEIAAAFYFRKYIENITQLRLIM